jgi:hypothetical protein
MKKYAFVYTNIYDERIPNNNFPEETESIVADDWYDFEDYLHDNGVWYEEDENTTGFYWMLDENGDRTDAAIYAWEVECTDDDIINNINA